MSRNFKLIEIRASDGSYRLVAQRLKEMQAWDIAMRLEKKEIEKPVRVSWYAVTNSSDWQSMAAAFYQMRKVNEPMI